MFRVLWCPEEVPQGGIRPWSCCRAPVLCLWPIHCQTFCEALPATFTLFHPLSGFKLQCSYEPSQPTSSVPVLSTNRGCNQKLKNPDFQMFKNLEMASKNYIGYSPSHKSVQENRSISLTTRNPHVYVNMNLDL